MTRFKAAAVGALAISLAAAPVLGALPAATDTATTDIGHYYGNPLYPVVGLAAAVVGTAAAIVTLALPGPGRCRRAGAATTARRRILSAAHARLLAAPGYAAPQAYYPAPAVSYAPPAPSYYYAPPAPYYAPRPAGYGGYDGYRGHNGYAANGGYYRPQVDAWRTERRQLRAAADTVRRPEWRLQPAPNQHYNANTR